MNAEQIYIARTRRIWINQPAIDAMREFAVAFAKWISDKDGFFEDQWHNLTGDGSSVSDEKAIELFENEK